jgi:hypothetical protein
MSEHEHCGSQLWHELQDFEQRYEVAKDQLSAADVFALWSALWRFSERVIVDHRRLKATERKRRRVGG